LFIKVNIPCPSPAGGSFDLVQLGGHLIPAPSQVLVARPVISKVTKIWEKIFLGPLKLTCAVSCNPTEPYYDKIKNQLMLLMPDYAKC